MSGIWSITVNLSGSSFKDSFALAQIAIDLICFAAVLVAWWLLPSKYKSITPAFNRIRYASSILLIWYISVILDLFLHMGGLQVVYGYIIFYFFIACAKFAADIFILAGSHRVLSHRLYNQLKAPIIWILTGEFLVIILVLLALYYLGSYLSNEVLWLNVGDQDMIQDVSSHADTFENAFFIIQFIFALFNLAGSLVSAWMWRKGHLNPTIPREAYFVIAATGILWIRSFSELIIVLQSHLQQNLLFEGTNVARDCVYGLCTAAFLFLITPAGYDTSSQEPSDPLQQKIQGDCHTYMLNAIKDEVDAGRQPPLLASVFQHMRQHPSDILTDTTKLLSPTNPPPTAPVLDYIGRLERQYEDYLPMDRSREY